MKAYLSGDQSYIVKLGKTPGDVYGLDITTTTVATTSPTTIDSFPILVYRSMKAQIQITQGTDYQVSDVLVIHDGSTASIIEYSSIATNDFLGTYSVSVSDNNCLLKVTMINSTSATVKVLSQKVST